MRRPPLGALVLAALITSSPLFAQPAPTGIADEVGRVRDRFLAAADAKRLDDFTALFAPDASMVAGSAGRFSGREAIHALWQRVLALYTTRSTMTRVRFEGSEDLAYESGDFAEVSTAVADGSRLDTEGTYLMVFRRQPAGSWQILELIYTERKQPTGGAGQ